MRLVSLRLLSGFCLALAIPTLASAQGANAAKKVPPGTYVLVADSGYAGPDVSTFTVRFEGDSLLVAEQEGQLMVRSKLTYEGQDLVWTDLEGNVMCPDVGRYKVTLGEGFVRFVPVSDPCDGRLQVVANVRFVKKA
jgi:hypothetical protein